jgi:azurin
MKKSKIIAVVAAAFLLAGFTSSLSAADAGKEVTITGSMVCGKCVLHETKSCQNVVQVTQDGKTVNYYLKQNDTSKAAHEAICGGSAEKVTVTGTVKEKDGKEIMTPSKIEPVKS